MNILTPSRYRPDFSCYNCRRILSGAHNKMSQFKRKFTSMMRSRDGYSAPWKKICLILIFCLAVRAIAAPPERGDVQSDGTIKVGQTDLVPLLDFEHLSPDDLETAASGDPALQAWLAKWCDRIQSPSTRDSEGELNGTFGTQLARILAASPVTAKQLLGIASCIRKYAATERRPIGELASASERRTLRDLAQLSVGSPEYIDALRDLISDKKLLWHAIDADSVKTDFIRTFLENQLSLCDALSKCEPGTEPDLINAKIHGDIGASECEAALGRDVDALRRLEKLGPDSNLNEEQRVARAWARATSYLKLHQFDLAFQDFSIVQASTISEHIKSARYLCIECLACAKRTDQAENQLINYLHRYRLVLSDVPDLADCIVSFTP